LEVSPAVWPAPEELRAVAAALWRLPAGLIHHHLHGPSLGYIGIAAGIAAGWLGVPGVGESLLIAGGVLAARGKLDLAELLAVAWLATMVGGTAGWAIGRRAGRPLLTAPGPLLGQREKGMERGERFFARSGVFAVYLVPAWVVGALGMRASRFLLANAAAGVVWTLLVGLGAYLVGPSITDVVDDLGVVGAAVLAAVAAVAVVSGVRRTRRRH
jgi:membrane-associated protein